MVVVVSVHAAKSAAGRTCVVATPTARVGTKVACVGRRDDWGLHRLNVFTQMVDVVLDRIQHQFDMGRIAMDVAITTSGTMFDTIEQRLQVVKLRVQLGQVAVQVTNATLMVCKFMDVIGKTRHVASVTDEMAVLGRMLVVSCFTNELVRLHGNLKC